MTLSDWINIIRWKYFTNEKGGLIFKELMKEFRMVEQMTENKRYDCEICKHKGICKVINILERNKEVHCPLITSNWGGLIMTEKTNIDDIIGIVKTEEKTDSVELKKEYYKNQSKDKQYTYLNYSRDGYIGSFYENDKPLTNKEVWDLLNEQEETIQKQNQEITACHDTLTTIHELCDAVLNNEFEGIVSKVDFCNMLIEMDNKDLAFLKECFESIKNNDLKTMTNLTLECKFGDVE